MEYFRTEGIWGDPSAHSLTYPVPDTQWHSGLLGSLSV